MSNNLVILDHSTTAKNDRARGPAYTLSYAGYFVSVIIAFIGLESMANKKRWKFCIVHVERTRNHNKKINVLNHNAGNIR